MNDSIKTLVIVGFLALILWNLGAGLYYMLVDKGQTKRTVNALTKRIALSIVLILLVVLAHYMGWIEFHGVGRNPDRAGHGRAGRRRPRARLSGSGPVNAQERRIGRSWRERRELAVTSHGSRGRRPSEDVDEQEQAQPDHV